MRGTFVCNLDDCVMEAKREERRKERVQNQQRSDCEAVEKVVGGKRSDSRGALIRSYATLARWYFYRHRCPFVYSGSFKSILGRLGHTHTLV